MAGLTPCYIFGVKALMNRALLFHCQLDVGAVFWALPLSAFVWKKDYEYLGLEEEIINELQWWNLQSSNIDITTFWYLEGYKADLKSRSNKIYQGTYLFTIDDYSIDKNPIGYSNDTDSKCFHIFKLTNGYFAAYPNDKILWNNLNFVNRNLQVPHYQSYSWDLRTENIL